MAKLDILDIWVEVAQEVRNTTDLRNLSLCSRDLRACAIPCLFDTFTVYADDSWYDHRIGNRDVAGYSWGATLEEYRTTHGFLMLESQADFQDRLTFYSSTAIAPYVRRLELAASCWNPMISVENLGAHEEGIRIHWQHCHRRMSECLARLDSFPGLRHALLRCMVLDETSLRVLSSIPSLVFQWCSVRSPLGCRVLLRSMHLAILEDEGEPPIVRTALSLNCAVD